MARSSPENTPVTSSARRAKALPAGIWALGFVSLLMDVSSEMIHALLPIYLVSVLHASPLTVGFIEGTAEALAMITKVVSGSLSDWLGRRKLLAVIGYGLAAATKPIFPMSTGIGSVVLARLIDRLGKGIRGAPRDALVADIAPPELRGAAFGLRQSLDTVGAFAGPVLAIGLMLASNGDYRLVFWLAVVPAVLSVALLLVAVKEPPHASVRVKAPLSRRQLGRLPVPYWAVVAVGSALALARFSEAFLILKAQDVDVAVALVPAVLVVMNVAYALSAYPVGILADAIDKRQLLALGLIVLIGADALLAAGSPVMTFAGVALWGLHMGLTQGLLATLVAETSPDNLRGTAFGLFNLLTGAAVLVSSAIAGALWTTVGPAATFLSGAGFAGLAILLLWLLRKPLTPLRAAVGDRSNNSFHGQDWLIHRPEVFCHIGASS